jgi:hypothetical protein
VLALSPRKPVRRGCSLGIVPRECKLEGVRPMVANRVGVALSAGFSALVLLAGIAAVAATGLPQGGEGASFINVILLGMLGGGFGAWWFARMARRVSPRAGEVRVTDNGVYLDGKRLIARSDIRSATLWPGQGAGACVRIQPRGVGASIDLVVRDDADGRRLIETLGFSASQTASELGLLALSVESLKSRVRGTWLGGATLLSSFFAAGFAGRMGLAGGWVAALVAAGLLFHITMLLRFFKRGSIVVGADGVHAQWLGQRRFIPIRDVDRAEVVQGEAWATMLPMIVRIHRKAGDFVDLLAGAGRVSAFGNFDRGARPHAEMIAERINEAAAASGRAPSDHPPWDERLLARGQRAMRDWVAALRKLDDKAPSFREHADSVQVLDRLWAILEDATMDHEKRAAAAVALSPHFDAADRQRVRIAARATATPKLRIALEAAAEDDEDRLVEALDEVATEGVAARRLEA